MASETRRVNLLCRRVAEPEDLCDVPAAFYVRLSRAMATLAGSLLTAVH